jgi:hypothetical protein
VSSNANKDFHYKTAKKLLNQGKNIGLDTPQPKGMGILEK